MALLTRSLAALALATSFVFSAQAQTDSNGLVLKSVARPQQTRLVPGGTVVLEAMLENFGETLAEGKIVAVVAGVTAETSARVVQLAPGTSEGVELYVQIPANLEGVTKVDVTCTLYVKRGNQEVIQSRGGRPAQYTIPLTMERMPSLAAVVMDPAPDEVPYWYWPKPGPSESYELAIASRIDTGNTRQTANYDAQALPVSAIDWSVADVIMIGEKRALDDAAFVESLKRFIAQGGRVWIMLDRVDSEAVRPLLGTGQMCETVDEIEVNKFVITRSNSSTKFIEADRTVESVNPFVFKRVIYSGGRVSHSIGDWPAAIWMPVGYGEVLLTTLECGAWIKKRADPSPYLLYQSEFESHEWAKDLASEVNDLRRNLPLDESVDYPVQLIGNPIVPRGWVATSLTCFCVLLAVLGVWRIWVGELGLLGLLAPVAAFAFGMVLIVASTYVRKDSPESDSRLQLVQVTDDGTAAIIREQGAVHLASSANMALTSEVDGTASIDLGMTMGIKRYVVTDFQKWEINNDTWQTGTWRFDTSYVLPVEDTYVSAELTSNGVNLTLPELPSALEDPVLSYGLGHPMLCTTDSTGLFADGSLQADGGRWVSGSIISDEQQRRLDVYQKFFAGGERISQLSRVLYGWTKPWDGGPKWTKELLKQGAALVALPVRITRPAEGEEVFVPYGLIPIRRNPAAEGQTFAFDPYTGTWQSDGLTNMLQAEMQFVLPAELTPFKASSIDIEFDITAPSRTVRLVGTSTTGNPIEIVKLESPSIPWKGTITDPEILAGVSEGYLDVKVEVSERKDSGTNVLQWNIERLQASVRGAVGQSSSIGN